MVVDDSYQRRLIRRRQMPVVYVIHFKLKLLTGPASVSAKCQYNVMNLSTHHISHVSSSTKRNICEQNHWQVIYLTVIVELISVRWN